MGHRVLRRRGERGVDMSYIDDTWVQSAYGALVATLDVDPHLRKEMVQFLLDEGFWDREKLSWDAAVARWNACLNPRKAEFFKVSELWALMRRFGRHQLFLALAEDLGYEVRLKPTEERRAELLDRMQRTLGQLEQAMADCNAQLARLDQAPTPPRSPVMSGAPRAFSLQDEDQEGRSVQRTDTP